MRLALAALQAEVRGEFDQAQKKVMAIQFIGVLAQNMTRLRN
jgi:hypothetical protein